MGRAKFDIGDIVVNTVPLLSDDRKRVQRFTELEVIDTHFRQLREQREQVKAFYDYAVLRVVSPKSPVRITKAAFIYLRAKEK